MKLKIGFHSVLLGLIFVSLTGSGIVFSEESKSSTNGYWFSHGTPLFPALKADPRQVHCSLGHRWHDQAYSSSSVAAVSLGGRVPIWKTSDYKWFDEGIEVGIEGGAWAVFNLSAYEFDLLNTDWYGGIPVYAKMGNWQFRARLYHLSSHLGDEYIIHQKLTSRLNPSFEAIDLTSYYNFNESFKAYGTLGHVLHYHSSFPMRSLYFELGGEVYWKPILFNSISLQATPYAATHLRFWEMHDFEPSSNFVLGLSWSDSRRVQHKLNTFIQYFTGHSLEGQFGKERADYMSCTISYDY
jgi:hypothetical protein